MIHLSIINDINMLIVYLRYIRFGNTFCRILRRDDPFYAWAIIFINPLDSVFSGYFLNVPIGGRVARTVRALTLI